MPKSLKGFPYPNGTDPVNGGADIIAGLATALDTRAFSIDKTAINAVTAPYSAYLPGATQIALTSAEASAGGWPITTYCQIVTYRDPAGGSACSQWCMSDTSGTTAVYFRPGNSGGWGAWVQLNTKPQASGRLTCTFSGTSLAYADATLPVNLFPNAPIVIATSCDATAFAVTNSSPTTTSIRVYVRRYDGAAYTGSISANWFATG